MPMHATIIFALSHDIGCPRLLAVVAEPVFAEFKYLFAQRDFSIERESFLVGASPWKNFSLNRFYLVNRRWAVDNSLTSIEAD